MNASVVVRDGSPFPSAVLRWYDDWGLPAAYLVSPPRRLWGDGPAPPAVESGIDARRVRPVPTPSQLLQALPEGDNWPAQTRRSLARLHAFFLIAEDPQRRLDARPVNTLSHQVSLVRHVLENEHLDRVLIADEVGLGKTIEAGLLVKEFLERRVGLRILYLAPARLVPNVLAEFGRLGLPFRGWMAQDGDARLTDPLIVASIHRAVHERHFQAILDTPPWDVLIVDECHHLSDWAPGGGDARQNFRLVRELIARQRPDGRVLMMSGTPHQGHPSRFENLLGLLKRPDEDAAALAGRVIYRTKEDVCDWHGNPLFPGRQVNEPLVLDLDSGYRDWLRAVRDYFSPQLGTSSEPQRRAAGWRCAQAMQWATSSPQAGLGYLVRQAIRASWTLTDAPLADCLAALRPYRLGPADEPIGRLFERVCKDVRQQQQTADVEDIEEGDAENDADRAGLAGLLEQGLEVLRRHGEAKWRLVRESLLDGLAGEKVVLFAQPVETVTAVARYLESAFGRAPAMILGGQSDGERRRQIETFRRIDGPQFLVSSRAGGEGINLQVARRLVHLDVPWNPMELEQRVGRVHRFGSRRTILVDTVVVKDSREADAYRVARQRLELIASVLVERERFESVFARVMSLVPPEDLQSVLIREGTGPLTHDDQEQLAAMVRAGFDSWSRFHERFAELQRRIRQQPAGLATWSDVEEFLRRHAKAETEEGFRAQTFVRVSNGIEAAEEDAVVLRLADGGRYACGDHAGTAVTSVDGPAKQLGLNLPLVSESLRSSALPTQDTGAAHVRWPSDEPSPAVPPFGILILLRQTVRTDAQTGWLEQGCSLRCYVVSDGVAVEAEGEGKRRLIDGLLRGTIRNRPELADTVVAALAREEERLIADLARPNDDDRREGLRHAVLPLVAAVITSG